MTTTDILRPFETQHTVRLTTFRRDGTPVGTAVSLAVDGRHGYFRTYESAGKFKRIRNNPIVEIAASTFGGQATGSAFRGRVRLLAGAEAERARRLITRKHPWLHGILVPLGHRLTGQRTVYFEVTPLDAAAAEASADERLSAAA
jgi:PPOX class probable F420-dependent enzyme